MKRFDKDVFKQELIEFTLVEVSKFIKNNSELEFYAFAYDYNIEYGQVGLCFNTEAEFKSTLKQYQDGDY